MTRLSYTEHLTEPDKKLAKQLENTHAGMAHFAGTGPRAATCRECTHWEFDGYLRTSALLKATVCAKFTALMNGRTGGRIPHHAAACKYFNRNDDAPPIYDPKT